MYTIKLNITGNYNLSMSVSITSTKQVEHQSILIVNRNEK